MSNHLQSNDLATKWMLVAITPEIGGLAFALGSNLRIGRSERNDIIIDSPKISRIHAKINKIGSKIFIQDLESAHGTYVNGKRLNKDAVRIKTNDELMFGDLLFIVQDDEHDRIIMPNAQPTNQEDDIIEIAEVEVEEINDNVAQPIYQKDEQPIHIETNQNHTQSAYYSDVILSNTIDLSIISENNQQTIANTTISTPKIKRKTDRPTYPSTVLYNSVITTTFDDELNIMKKPPFFIMLGGGILIATLIILAIFSFRL